VSAAGYPAGRVGEMRLLVGFVAGMVTPLAPVFVLQSTCAGDQCFGLYAYLFGALPAGMLAGIVAATATPRGEGRTGWLVASLGVFVGAFLMGIVNDGQPGPVVGALLVGTPIAIALSLAYWIVRLIARAIGHRRPTPATGEESS
jgi:peptidoglycan/LPS O-acetylase OafA/YrhL